MLEFGSTILPFYEHSYIVRRLRAGLDTAVDVVFEEFLCISPVALGSLTIDAGILYFFRWWISVIQGYGQCIKPREKVTLEKDLIGMMFVEILFNDIHGCCKL